MKMQNSSSTEARFIILGPQPQKSACCDNSIFTAKYTLINFIPKALLLQFLRLSNIVFLANVVLQSIPMISSLSPLTALAPLCFVLLVSLFRQAYQDCKRHSKDNEINLRKTRVLREGQFQEVQWRDVRVGDFIKVKNKQIIPCDILLLFSSQQNSMCYVQTANLDGQNNLKQKFAFTEDIKTFPEELERLVGRCRYGLPKAGLHEFDATISIGRGDEKYIGVHNLLLRETTLKNTDQIVGLALYCGHDSKILKNQGLVHHKVSQIQTKLNYIQVGLLFILGAISGSCSLGFSIIHHKNNLRNVNSYIPLQGVSLPAQSGINIFTIFLLLNFLIPISLVIFIEAIKTFSGVFLSMDKKFEDKQTESSCGVLNCSLIEELGVIDFILTDKTGTLTANQMVFQKIAIENLILTREELLENAKELYLSPKLNEFLLCMSICHQVVNDHIKGEYQGSSPDQVCFVNFTKIINYEFLKRTQISIELNVDNKKVVYKLVEILKFDSRKRMSVVVQLPEKQDQVIIYTKGADNQVFDKSKPYPLFTKLHENLNNFATEGLRTLVFAKRKMKMHQYEQFIERRSKLKFNFVQRNLTKEEYNTRLNRIVEEIESELEILGVSGIEDRLQEEVPQTIQRLQRAGITVIMITGDKLQTAQNIGYLARFIKNGYRVVRLASNDITTQETIQSLVSQIQAEDISVIIQGNQISRMLKQEDERIIKLYSNMFQKAKSIIFCRTSPKEKAEIAKFIKHNLKVVVLAIGDGGNDVGMIEEAQIGVGIIGKEGNSAAAVSDFSFAKFKFLDRLLLHHGRWFYYRLSYFFIFCGWKNTIITFLMYFANIFNSFSGIINFTQTFYTLYNSFFAVVQTIYFGLYQQDINDDLQTQIKDYLPEIYKQTKERDLFSFKRYVLWSISGIIGAIFMYFITMLSLNPLTAINQYGRPADVITERLSNGIALSLIVILINYIDTQSHTFFFEVILFWLGSLGLTGLFFVFQNYFSFMDYYQCYRENMNPRFWLVISLVVIACVMVKMTIQTYYFQTFPSVIDMYKKYKHGKYESFKLYLEQKKRIVLPDSDEIKDNCQTDEELQFYSSKLSKSFKDRGGKSRIDKIRLNFSQEVGTMSKFISSDSKPNETSPQNNVSFKQVNVAQPFSLTK